jgi:LmbE family N-acetylglucosaminyl deacetylase
VTRRTILGVFAHPDDESMGPGATFAKYAAAGHRVAFLTATDGAAGRMGKERPADHDGRKELGETRRRETLAAAEILGVESLGFLGWEDRGLASRNILEVELEIAALFRREKPDVVVTFHGSGISYHPDHRVISLAVMGAFLGSGREGWYREGAPADIPPHAPSKLYGMTPPRDAEFWNDWPRQIYLAPTDEITTIIDTADTEETKWAAIRAHETQQYGPPFRDLYEAGAFRRECFVRIFPSPPTAETLETDLLEGLS